MSREPRFLLDDILESIEAIEEFSEGMSEYDLKSSRLKQSAITREFEIIGEAVKNLPSQFKEDNPDVPWKEIAGMRDVIIHNYFRVDIDSIWNAIKKDIPVLKEQISQLMKDR